MSEYIALSSRVRFRSVGNDGVLVHLDSGRVIVINEVGLFIVDRLGGGPVAREELVAAITDMFEVSADEARGDLDRFLAELDGEQVLRSSG